VHHAAACITHNYYYSYHQSAIAMEVTMHVSKVKSKVAQVLTKLFADDANNDRDLTELFAATMNITACTLIKT